MDIGILIGFLGTWALIGWAMMAGGKIGIYIDIPSLVLVAGCCGSVLFFAYPMANVKSMIGVIKKSVFVKPPDMLKVIADLVSFAEIARRDGILALEGAIREIEDPFLVQGMQMAVDGTDPEFIEQIMETDLENTIERHEIGKAMIDAVVKYAPAFGMIGTLVGLVAMLSDLSDPAGIGAGMAVALLTTMYGAMVANAFGGPIADRLARRSGEEVLYKTVIIKGVMSIQSGDNPRVVEAKLRTFLPPSMRPAADEDAA